MDAATAADRLFDPSRYAAGGVPHDRLDVLRLEDPVRWFDRLGEEGYWLLTRHEDVLTVSRDPQTFSSSRGTMLEVIDERQRTLPHLDGPQHTSFRRLINRGFTPRQVGALEPHVRAVADDLIAAARQKQEPDFVTDIAAPFSLRVITELIGIPASDQALMFELTNKIAANGTEDPEYLVDPAESFEAMLTLWSYAEQLGAARRADPKDDIVTTLVEAEPGGESLTPDQFNQFMLLLVVAGNETTRNTLSHALCALTDFPDQKQMLIDEPWRIDGAVEEALRWATPVLWFSRTTTADVELDGRQIGTGQWVVMHYAAANRDPAVFAHPHRFDITRDPNPHVAFGGGGPHFCLGAQLARLEVRCMLQALLEHVPDVVATGPPDRLRSNFFNGIKHLPVSFGG